MRLAILAFLLLIPFAHGVSYSTTSVELNRLAILSAQEGDAIAIIYAVSDEGAEVAFVARTTVVMDGDELPNGDPVSVEFEGEGLKSILIGKEPDRSGWVDFLIAENAEGAQMVQRIHSSAEGYESIFSYPFPPSFAGRRVWIAYANDYWLVAELNSTQRAVLLYQEAAYGLIRPDSELAFDEYGLSYLGFQDGKAIVRFRAGNEKTTLLVQDFNDLSAQRLVLWADYNYSQGIVQDANCYLEGDIRGSLSFLDGRYKAQLDYADLPERVYSYAVSCSRAGYEPKTLARFLNITEVAAPPPATVVIPTAPVHPEITQAPPYTPPKQEKTLFDILDELLSNPFWWLR